VCAATSIFFIGVLSYAVKAQLSKIKTGAEGLVGEIGSARTDINPVGKVFVHGELWDASSDRIILKGEQVAVLSVEGMKLKVTKE
jgi:membrane-bound serine protease (ClpP class)